MIRAGIIGCGKIADSHAEQLARLSDVTLHAVCDSEPIMAEQLARRFGVPKVYNNAGELLQSGEVEAVHITTPPKTHFELAKQSLEAGLAAYVEKPLTLDATSTEELIQIAQKSGCILTVGHDDQYTHASRRTRELIRSGYIGSAVRHIESYYCYDIDCGYGRAIVKNEGHWVRSMPGQLFQNIISHGIARIAEYMTDDIVSIRVDAYQSPTLVALGEKTLKDELRVYLRDSAGATAYFTVGSEFKPTLHHFRVYGEKNGIIMDHDQDWVSRAPGISLPSFAEKFIPSARMIGDQGRNILYNARQFFRSDFHMKSGMKYLFEEFYASVQENAEEGPIPYSEINRCARIMDMIFERMD